MLVKCNSNKKMYVNVYNQELDLLNHKTYIGSNLKLPQNVFLNKWHVLVGIDEIIAKSITFNLSDIST